MGRHSDTEQEIELMVSYINPSDRKGHHRMVYTLRKDGSGPHGWTISDY